MGRRRARVIGFRTERIVTTTRIEVPVSAHPIDSISLKDPKLGIYTQLAEFVARADPLDNHLFETFGCGPAPETQLTCLTDGGRSVTP